MMVARNKRFAGVVAVAAMLGGRCEAQNGTGKAPIDYVDTLIGTINGGMGVGWDGMGMG
jgi:hypothetical protein